MNWCVVIPTYNNSKTLEGVIKDVLKYTGNIFVVNDGSTDNTSEILSSFPQINVISYSPNSGKGIALQRGFTAAYNAGFSYAITIDSDGQHYAKDIQLFVKKCEEAPDSLIIGERTLPSEKLRRGSGFANKFSNFWFTFISGVSLPDTQSGFRLYPLHLLINKFKFFSKKYEFELEVLIRSAWRGIKIESIPISVYYPEKEERVSHYRPFRDFFRISVLNTICVFVSLFYIKPFSFLRHLKKENIKGFLKKNVLQVSDSDIKITLSVMLGIFMGIVPIWGYQLISAIALAYLLRLNIVIVALAANISIFPFTAVILYLSYITGGFVLSADNHIAFSSSINLDWFKENVFQYLIGAITFAFIASVFFGIITYFSLKFFRKQPAN